MKRQFVGEERMNENVWSNGGMILTGELKYWEKNIIQCGW
jgi:hypothetical protein